MSLFKREEPKVPHPAVRADVTLLMDHLPTAVFAVTATGEIFSWNRAAVATFGYGTAEAIGQKAGSLLGQGDTLQSLITRACTEELGLLETEVSGRHKDGRDLDIRYAIAALPDRRTAVISAQDVSNEKKATRRTAAKHAVTRALSNATTPEQALKGVLAGVCSELDYRYAAIWTPDAAGSELTCVMTWHAAAPSLQDFDNASRRVRLRKGIGLPGRVWGQRLPLWIPALEQDPNFPRATAAAAAGLHSAVAVPINVAGRLFGVMEFMSRDRLPEDDATLGSLLGIASEVGQYILRMRAETDLRRSEQLFRTLAETASDAILTMDERSTITFANAAVSKIFGYRAEELIGRRMMVLMPKRLRKAHRAGVMRYRATGKKHMPWSAIELVGRHRDGHEIPIEVSFGEFVSGAEHVFTGIVRDITDRNKQRVALEEAAAELQNAVAQLEERSAEVEAASNAKSEFLAAMSHELRTPLQAVIGYTGLLCAGLGGPLTDDQEQKLARIQLSAEHLLQLIDQVLDVARFDVGSLRLHLEPVDINRIAAEACDLIRPQADSKGLQLECDFGVHDRLGAVRGDRQRVRQILLNLLTNAVKFTDHGHVEVRTTISEEGGIARIDVIDTGVGLTSEEAERVFQPFYQAEGSPRKRAAGTGLGLSISRRLALAMGGLIDVESERGKGSRFTLVLPLEHAREAAPGATARQG